MKVVHIFTAVIFTLGLVKGSPVKFPEDVDSRVIQGWPAANGQFPHQVHLRMVTGSGSLNACGGSLIHPQWVLTAAHCMTQKTVVFVRLGDVNVTTPNLILESTNYTIHPQYDSFNLNNDLALINLGRRVEISDRIKPIRIPRRDAMNVSYVGRVVTVSGWGRTNNTGPTSETMNYVNLTVIENSQCEEEFVLMNETIIDSTICAAGIDSSAQSSCNGDSGGSLMMVEEDGLPTLVGVVSFVSDFGCDADFPSGYVRPHFFHDWITNVTGIAF